MQSYDRYFNRKIRARLSIIFIESKGEIRDVVNPATGKIITKVPISTKDEIDAAVEAAREAYPDWRRTTPVARSRYLFRLKELLEENFEEVSRIQTQEHGKTIDEYVLLAKRINDVTEIAGIEVNISCPNVKAGGVAFGVDPKVAYTVVQEVKKNTDKVLMVKLSPNVTDIVSIAKSVESAGADCLSLINTITGMAIDVETRKPRLANITGGLSGPAIKPVALRMVWQAAQAVKIPIIGCGGITCAEDALEFFIAGATAVQMGAYNLIDPKATIKTIEGLRKYLIDHNEKSIKDIIGTMVLS